MHGNTAEQRACLQCPFPARASASFDYPEFVRVLAASACCVSALAHAQPAAPPKATTLDPVAVTASRSPQPIADLLADLTIIDAATILRSGAQSLPQLLQRQPGVEVTIAGGPGATSGAFLRGANPGQTLVLIDGLRVGSSSQGATSLEAIPLDQIERIEILRGPASSLYGADAIGGVIQVFTKQAEGNSFAVNASAGYGTYDTRNVNGGVRGAMGPLRFSVQAGGTRSTGFNAIENPGNFSYNGDRDGYSTENVGANAVLPWAEGQEVAATYFRNRLNNQYDGGPGFDDRTLTTLEAWSVASRNKLAPWWSSTLTAGAGSDDSVSQTGFGDYPFNTTQRQYTWQNDFTLPVGALSVDSRTARGASRDERAVRRHRPRYELGHRRVPAALWRFRVAGQPAPRRFEPVRRPDHRRPGARLQAHAGVALHCGLQHGLPRTFVQRPLLPGLLQSESRTGDLRQHRARRLLDRQGRASCAGRRARSATTTRSTTSSCSNAMPISTACRAT